MVNQILKLLIAASFLLATISNAGVFNTPCDSGHIANSDVRPKNASVDLEINFFDSDSGVN